MKKLLLSIVGLVISCSAWFVVKTHTHVPYAVMSYKDYSTTRGPVPYRYAYSKQGANLFYCGMSHSFDPENAEYDELELWWQKFLAMVGKEQAVVLVEGSKRPLCSTKREAIMRAGGEGGYITWRAHQEGIAVECPELPYDELRKQLIKTFTEDEINYCRFAQNTLQFIRAAKTNSSLVFTHYVGGRLPAGVSVESMIAFHEKLWGKPFALDEQLFYEMTNPVVELVAQETVVNRICRQASWLRDQQIVHYIDELIVQGKHVFVVFGATHAVMHEPAFKALGYTWVKVA